MISNTQPKLIIQGFITIQFLSLTKKITPYLLEYLEDEDTDRSEKHPFELFFVSSLLLVTLSFVETFNHLYAKKCILYSPITFSLFPQTTCTINHSNGQG